MINKLPTLLETNAIWESKKISVKMLLCAPFTFPCLVAVVKEFKQQRREMSPLLLILIARYVQVLPLEMQQIATED